MGRKKEEKAPEGAPDWMVTYGDMMTLLLCFFVMLVAMSEIKKDERYLKVVESMQKQFGYNNAIGTTRSISPPDVSPRRKRRATADENKDLTKGLSAEDSQEGDHDLVRQIREGEECTVGSVADFKPGTAELVPDAHYGLMKMANEIRGLEFKIEVRGHCSTSPLLSSSPYRDHMDLSIARARTVRDWLVNSSEDKGRIDPRRIRIVGAGQYEPLEDRVYVPAQLRTNDRVDVIQIEALAQDFEGRKVASAVSGR